MVVAVAVALAADGVGRAGSVVASASGSRILLVVARLLLLLLPGQRRVAY